MANKRREGLTLRQWQILEKALDGEIDREIGTALKISRSSVPSAARRVFRKVGITSRCQAAVLWGITESELTDQLIERAIPFRRRYFDRLIRVARRVALGAEDRQIVEKEGLSRNAVKNDIGYMLKKLGIDNRVHLANIIRCAALEARIQKKIGIKKRLIPEVAEDCERAFRLAAGGLGDRDIARLIKIDPADVRPRLKAAIAASPANPLMSLIGKQWLKQRGAGPGVCGRPAPSS